MTRRSFLGGAAGLPLTLSLAGSGSAAGPISAGAAATAETSGWKLEPCQPGSVIKWQGKDGEGKGAYWFCKNSEPWKEHWEWAPCALTPGYYWWSYGTAAYNWPRKNDPLVIQLWKGYCQKFPASTDCPGGFGAEVAVYRRSMLTQPGIAPSSVPPAWVPVTDIPFYIKFALYYESDGVQRCLFQTPKQDQTWWQTMWMLPDSWKEYQAANGGSKVPQPPWESMTLNYVVTINSQDFKRGSWTGPAFPKSLEPQA